MGSPLLMSRSYAMTLPPLCPDASRPIYHLGTYCPCPPCDALAQVLLWTSVLYARREVRSIADIPHSGSVITIYPTPGLSVGVPPSTIDQEVTMRADAYR